MLRPGALFAACAPNRDSHPELASVRPHWGEASTFNGEDAVAIVASVFSDPGDRIEVERCDAPLRTLDTAGHAASFLRVHGMSATAARAATWGMDLPLTLTMRGCVVYATMAPCGGSCPARLLTDP